MYYNAGERAAFIFLAVYLSVLGVLAVGYIASYVLRGVGLYTISRRRGMNYPGLAFVPYARIYLQGEICGTIYLGKRKINNPGLFILLLPVISNFIAGVLIFLFYGGIVINVLSAWNAWSTYGYYGPEHMYSGMGSGILAAGGIIFFLLALAVKTAGQVLTALVNHQIYARYTKPSLALAHAVAGLFIPLYTSVYFFIIRDREKGVRDRMN